jgi:hypothetical protein
MARLVAVVICALILPLASPAQASAPIELPALTRLASKLSGISRGRGVRVVYVTAAGMRRQATRLLDRDYPPDQQDYDQTLYRALGLLGSDESLRPLLLESQTRNVLGLYDPLARVLYARSGPRARAAVLHELVHALQDQAFDLRRLSSLRGGSRDAAAAASAAVEGDALFATNLFGGRTLAVADRRAAAATTPMESFLSLEHDFPYATGLRFVATLHNLGGNRAVFSALRTFPKSTKQVFHVDAFLTREEPEPVELSATAGGLPLVRSDTFGELDVRALLATFHVPGLDRAATGWTGGRTGIYRDGTGRMAVVVDLSWETDLDAARWSEAVGVYVNEAFDADVPGFPPPVSCASTVCWNVAGRGIAFRRVGNRTALVVGASADAAAAAASSLDLR